MEDDWERGNLQGRKDSHFNREERQCPVDSRGTRSESVVADHSQHGQPSQRSLPIDLGWRIRQRLEVVAANHTAWLFISLDHTLWLTPEPDNHVLIKWLSPCWVQVETLRAVTFGGSIKENFFHIS